MITFDEKKLYVFVYGSLKNGFYNHHVLEGAEFITNLTLSRRFGFAMVDVGAYPALVMNDEHKTQILGEVYKINEKIFDRLDGLEGYPEYYSRLLLTGEIEKMLGADSKCWVYYWNHFVESPHTKWVETGEWQEKPRRRSMI
jgi:gamma-glutamylaminecyclotransferase